MTIASERGMSLASDGKHYDPDGKLIDPPKTQGRTVVEAMTDMHGSLEYLLRGTQSLRQELDHMAVEIESFLKLLGKVK